MPGYLVNTGQGAPTTIAFLNQGEALPLRGVLNVTSGLIADDDPDSAVIDLSAFTYGQSFDRYDPAKDYSVDVGALLNQACADVRSAGGGALYIPAGHYKIGQEINSKNVYLHGDGVGATILQWPTDLGSSLMLWDHTEVVAGVSMQGANGLSYADSPPDFGTGIAGMELRGPGYGSLTLNTRPAWMHGIRLGGGGICSDVRAEGFNGGCMWFKDHERVRDCVFTRNFYGLYCGESDSGGDQSFIHLDLRGNALSSLGQHGNQVSGGYVLQFCQFGKSPYCMLKEESQDHTYAEAGFLNIALIGCRFQDWGNGIVGIQNVNWVLPSLGDPSFIATLLNCFSEGDFNATYYTASYGKAAPVHCGSIKGTRVIGSNPFKTPGTECLFKVSDAEEISIGDMGEAIDACRTAGLPVFKYSAPSGGFITTGGRMLYYNSQAGLQGTAEAITEGHIVEVGNSGMRPAGTNTSPHNCPVGGALITVASGVQLPVQYNGPFSFRAASATTVGALKLLRVDNANPGCIKEATGPTDGPIVGYSTAAKDGSNRVAGVLRGL